MVLFTSAIVVGALLLLGAALHALLAKSLYTQQSSDAVQQVGALTRRVELAEASGQTTAEVQETLQNRLRTGSGGQPSFKALVLRGTDGVATAFDPNIGFKHVPASLADRVANHSELAYVYIRSPIGPGRMLVVGGGPAQASRCSSGTTCDEPAADPPPVGATLAR